MNSSRGSPARSIEEHLSLGLPVLFSELLVFKWTPNKGFPVENLGNELRVFFSSYEGALDAFEKFEVRRNTLRFLDQYGTIDDLLKNELLRTANSGRGLVPEYLEERIRNQQKWFKGKDRFSMEFAREFLRRKFSTVRNSFRAPQPISLLPPVPPPRRHRSGSSIQQSNRREQPSDGLLHDSTQPSTSQAVYGYTASGRPRRNSAPVTTRSSPKSPRQLTAQQLPSPPPTPPPLQHLQQPPDQPAAARNGDHRSDNSFGAVLSDGVERDPKTSPAPTHGTTDQPALPSGEPSVITTGSTILAANSETVGPVAVNFNQINEQVSSTAATAGRSGPTTSKIRTSAEDDNLNDEPVAALIVERMVEAVVQDLARAAVIDDSSRLLPAQPDIDDKSEDDKNYIDKVNNNNHHSRDRTELGWKKTAVVTDKLSKVERFEQDDRPLQETAM
ncbi:hypothetical protein BIW11_07463 [Tropilaelaps mercedesae]|uniref:Uncharacterized protein n=1 Tax=Tropilaelaps mercedesae TaxID=418985 RepID=A0A1V9XTZ4_9ACAR|nr:hypothetical protein BIW11_07463 [Tropilaelaps mercedesae]